MLDKLGLVGVVGILLFVGGFGVVAWYSLEIAVGLALMVAGLGLVVRSLVSSALAAFGMGGMV